MPARDPQHRGSVEWAYRKGLHKPSISTVIDAIAADISKVDSGKSTARDPSGQRYRAKHAVRSKQGGKTPAFGLTSTSERAPREHFRQGRSLRGASKLWARLLPPRRMFDCSQRQEPCAAPYPNPDFTLDVEEPPASVQEEKGSLKTERDS